MNKRNEDGKIKVYEYIIGCLESNGRSPTTLEISRATGMAASTVSKFVNRLIDEGMLEKVGRYQLSAAIGYHSRRMPVIGSIACGKPRLAVEDIIGYIPLDSYIGEGEYFGLVAQGSSMINVGISDGDVVYVKKQSTADDGDIVVALIEDGESDFYEATLKRFFRDEKNGRYILHPENDFMDDIIVNDVRILGVAVRVLKDLCGRGGFAK